MNLFIYEAIYSGFILVLRHPLRGLVHLSSGCLTVILYGSAAQNNSSTKYTPDAQDAISRTHPSSRSDSSADACWNIISAAAAAAHSGSLLMIRKQKL